MQNICLIGASGRMGQSIQGLLPSSLKVYCFTRLNGIDDALIIAVQKCDMVIDFSNPENLETVVNACVEGKTPLLCGTTGLNQKHFDLLKSASENIPVLYAANTSIGVAILKKAVTLVANTFHKTNLNIDIAIHETHHNLKKDAPSGTALSLGNAINENFKNIINYSSIRGGNVVGEHTVHFFHKDEAIHLSHECLNRNVFSEGAIKAAEWLVHKPSGFYSIDDVLDLD